MNDASTPSPPPSLAILDAHCHIDLYPDPRAVLLRVEALRVRTIAVTNAPSRFLFTRDLVARCQFVRPAIGLHPELVHLHVNELDQFWPALEETRYVGEVGLDYVTTDKANREQQRRVFDAILSRCSGFKNKVLTIHSRRAAADVIAAVGPSFSGRPILHWFSGSIRQVEQAAGAGFFFSVNPAMVRSATSQKLIAAMPKERILTESDGPFVKTRGQPAEPSDTALVVQALAKLWKIEPGAARQAITDNLRVLLE